MGAVVRFSSRAVVEFDCAGELDPIALGTGTFSHPLKRGDVVRKPRLSRIWINLGDHLEPDRARGADYGCTGRLAAAAGPTTVPIP